MSSGILQFFKELSDENISFALQFYKKRFVQFNKFLLGITLIVIHRMCRNFVLKLYISPLGIYNSATLGIHSDFEALHIYTKWRFWEMHDVEYSQARL